MSTTVFQGFPVFAYEKIFRCLDQKELLVCRLVCSEWYKNIIKIFKFPNCYSMGENNNEEQGKISKKPAMEKYFVMKCYEDLHSPVEVLNIQTLSILKWRECLQESKDFQGTVKNITELKLKNIIFQNAKMVVKFLCKFDKLTHLAIYNCCFGGFRKEYVKKKWMGKSYTARLPELCSKPKILDVEMKENSWAMALIIEILSSILVNHTLEELQLTILSPGKENLLRKFFDAAYDIGSNRSPKVVRFLRSVLTKHELTLKSLNISWKALECDVTLYDTERFALLVRKDLSKFCQVFQRLSVAENQLQLSRFKINLGKIAFQPFINVWFLRYLKRSLIPFLKLQIQRGLREIDLGPLLSVGFPIPLISLLRELRYDMEVIGHPCDCDNVLRIKYAHEFLTTGTRDILNEFHRYFDKNTISPCMSYLIMEKLTVMIKNHLHKIPENIVENFREYLWNYDLPIEANFKLRYEDYDFTHLKELVIACDMKLLKSFNISTICFLCPNLTKLKIVDGPEFKYKRRNLSSQYELMSQAVINDYDLKFIFSSLVHLKELIIWANMSTVSDTGFISADYLTNGNGQTEYRFGDHESYHEFAKMVNLYNKDAKEIMAQGYKISTTLYLERCERKSKAILDQKTKDLASVSISNLQELAYLSLRGVGNKMTDKVLSSEYGVSGLKNLKNLEILGNHNINPYQVHLNQRIKFRSK